MSKRRILVVGLATAGLVLVGFAGGQVHAPSASALPVNTTYYVDNGAGSSCSDSGAGTSTAAPWCDFANINGTTFAAGDQIRLMSGDTWTTQLSPLGSGTSGSDISIGCYGTGCATTWPEISLGTSSSSGVYLTDPSHWSVSDLSVHGGKNGIWSHFTTLNHVGLSFAHIYTTGTSGVGILFDGFNSNPQYTVPTGSDIVSGVSISNSSINDTGDGGISFLADYENAQEVGPSGAANAQQDVTISNVDATNIGGCAFNLLDLSHALVLDSSVNNADTGGGCGTGNYEVNQNDVRYVNGDYEGVAWNQPGDNSLFNIDNNMTNVSWLGDSFSDVAGSALEWTENPCFASCTTTTDTGTTVADDAFSDNSTENSSSYFGDIDTTYAPESTGAIEENLFYDAPQTYNAFAHNTSDYTVTGNRSADSAADLYNGGHQYSGTQGMNDWSYVYWNGSTWSNMTFSSATNSWSGSTGASISRFDETPDASNGDYVAREWTAPKSGAVSIRGWALMNTTGGSGVGVGIVDNGTWLMPAGGSTPGTAPLSGSDQTGFATNVDTTVTAGDKILFLANDGDHSSNADDTISWNPSVAYTSSNLALGQSYFSSSNYDSTQVPNAAFDGDIDSDWQAGSGVGWSGQYLGVNFAQATTFDEVKLAEYGGRTSGFEIRYYNGSTWQTAYTGTTIGPSKTLETFTFAPVTGSEARVLFTSGTGAQPVIYEFEVHD